MWERNNLMQRVAFLLIMVTNVAFSGNLKILPDFYLYYKNLGTSFLPVLKPVLTERKGIFDSRIDDTKLLCDWSDLGFEIGKHNKKWEPELSSIIISNELPSYPQIGFGKGKLEYLANGLRSLIADFSTNPKVSPILYFHHNLNIAYK